MCNGTKIVQHLEIKTNGKNYEEINDDDDDGDVEKVKEKQRKKI